LRAPERVRVDDQLQHMSRSIQGIFPDGPVALMGHSLGGVPGLYWAFQHASRVSRIVLLNTPLGESREDTMRSLLAGRFGWASLMLEYPRLAQSARWPPDSPVSVYEAALGT
jgi:alpha-beta hydrolase superfamily lysophospholipase